MTKQCEKYANLPGAEYTTFTDRASGDWAEMWGDRTSSFNKNAYGNGWLLAIIVRYFNVSIVVLVVFVLLFADL